MEMYTCRPKKGMHILSSSPQIMMHEMVLSVLWTQSPNQLSEMEDDVKIWNERWKKYLKGNKEE